MTVCAAELDVYPGPTRRQRRRLERDLRSTREALEQEPWWPPIHWQAPGTSYRRRGAEHVVTDATGFELYSWKDPDEIRWRAPLHD